MADIYNFESSLQKLLIRIGGLDADADPLKKWYLHLKPKEKHKYSQI